MYRPLADGTVASDCGCGVVASRHAAAPKAANAASTTTVRFENMAALLEGVHEESLAKSVPILAPPFPSPGSRGGAGGWGTERGGMVRQAHTTHHPAPQDQGKDGAGAATPR